MKKPVQKPARRRRVRRRPPGPLFHLRLYVTGATPRSQRAIVNIRKICQQYLEGRFHLEVIDIYKHPTLGRGEQIIASPTLIRKLPLPLRRFIGDLSDTQRILLGLDLLPEPSSGSKKRNPRRS